MDRKSLRDSLENFIQAWEQFLMDQINTTQLTDALIEHMKVVEKIASDPSENPSEPF